MMTIREPTNARKCRNCGKTNPDQNMKLEQVHEYPPVINAFDNFICLHLPKVELQVFINPFNKVILEYTFDKLMKDIRCKKLVYVSTWEAVHEQLRKSFVKRMNGHNQAGYRPQCHPKCQIHPTKYWDQSFSIEGQFFHASESGHQGHQVRKALHHICIHDYHTACQIKVQIHFGHQFWTTPASHTCSG